MRNNIGAQVPATNTKPYTYADGQVRTITYLNATLKGEATKTQTLPKSAWQTGRGNFSITIGKAKKTGADEDDGVEYVDEGKAGRVGGGLRGMAGCLTILIAAGVLVLR